MRIRLDPPLWVVEELQEGEGGCRGSPEGEVVLVSSRGSLAPGTQPREEEILITVIVKTRRDSGLLGEMEGNRKCRHSH